MDNLKVPNHIAFIMDGNGRWAKKRSLPRSAGHKEGVKALERIGEYCKKIGIGYVTVYALSTENLSRPEDEVSYLLSLFKDYIDKALKESEKKETHVRIIGDPSILGEEYEKKIEKLDQETEKFDFTLIIAFNYGSRAEIVRAFNELSSEGKKAICADDLESHLYTSGVPDPDLIVRSAGEKRLSNFLLWQAAYSEFYFTDVLWPDMREKDVDDAISDFGKRKRNFGKSPDQK